MPFTGAHTWSDVAYLALFVILTVANVLHNKAVSKKADQANAGVVDVKRATGLVNRAEDPDPPPPPVTSAPVARITDPPGTTPPVSRRKSRTAKPRAVKPPRNPS